MAKRYTYIYKTLESISPVFPMRGWVFLRDNPVIVTSPPQSELTELLQKSL